MMLNGSSSSSKILKKVPASLSRPAIECGPNLNHWIYQGLLACLLALLFFFPAAGQSQHGMTGNLRYPWTGGLNSCQFVTIDLDLDGIQDLLIFDRHGNRKLTFINTGTPGVIDYRFEPSFARLLPAMTDWVITADYDRDGRMDLFTYNNGGVMVYRNVSDKTLAFNLVTDLLESFYYTGKVGILVTSVDYPGIADIDGDGDLDLLTFFGLGSFLEYHKNLSMEKYGHCDSLDFRLTDPCWGRFKESESGNRITLNADCPFEAGLLTVERGNVDRGNVGSGNVVRGPWTVGKGTGLGLEGRKGMGEGGKETGEGRKGMGEGGREKGEGGRDGLRHTGSTLLVTDLNGDGLQDLVLGDFDFPGLIGLINGGTRDNALMVAQDTLFPSGSKTLYLFSFPNATLADPDNDGIKDLICSPFDPALFTADNYRSVWFYKNTGTQQQPDFSFVTDRFFRDEMLDFGSASHPVLYDFDRDGLDDLFVGNYGYYDSSWYHQGILHSGYSSRISYYRNTGTIDHPFFTFITDNLADAGRLNITGLYPAFGDLNGDGATDLLCGNSDGTLILYLNNGGQGPVPEFNPPVKKYQGIDAGENSTPQLFDLDKDGRPELIIGNRSGNILCYKDIGVQSQPVFTKVSDSLGRVNVTNYQVSYDGNSTPCFFRQPDGTTLLVCGSDEGRIHFYDQIDNHLDEGFNERTDLFNLISANPADTLFGWQTSPAIAFISSPDSFDMITGNFSGGLNYVSKRQSAEIIPGLAVRSATPGPGISAYPNPADDHITITQARAETKNKETFCKSMPGNEPIRITNFLGQQVGEFSCQDPLIISTTHLPDGIYMVRAGHHSVKLIIRHP